MYNVRIVAAFERKVLDPATRCDGNGKESKVQQASIGQYVVRQHAGALGGRHTSEKVSVTGKESSEYAHHGSTANHIQSGPTWTANMKGRAGSEDNWSKTGRRRTRAERNMEERGPPRHCENCVRKTRWSRQSPHDIFLTVTRNRVPNVRGPSGSGLMLALS